MDDVPRANISHNPLPVSPLKHHYNSYNGNTFDRGSYLSHMSIGGYPDYVSPQNTFASPRIQAFTDPHSSTFAPSPFGNSNLHISGSATNYWNESRSHSGYGDPYTTYPDYNKYTGTYDTYSRHSSLLHGSVYHQENLTRSAFDPPRSLYRSHENIPGNLLVCKNH